VQDQAATHPPALQMIFSTREYQDVRLTGGMMRALLTRRDFLERAALSSAVLAMAKPATAADGMYVSLNGAVTRGVGGLEKIRLAGKLGYGGVDWDLGPAKAAGVATMKALLAELKIKPTITNLPMTRPLPFAGETAAFQQALPQLAEDAAFSAAIGCGKMMVVLSPTGPVPKEEHRKNVRDRIGAVADVLQKSNIRLGLEFLGVQQFRVGRADGPPPNPFIWTLPETLALAKDCGPNIGVILDVWHWHHSGGTVADILAAEKDRIVHVHVSDARPQPPEEVRDNQRVMPGEGSIDLVGFFQALKKIGYADGVSPEPLGRVPAEMSPEEGAKLALETTLAVMKKAGVA
jgi:sugar phosphate isomerase/epimerase